MKNKAKLSAQIYAALHQGNPGDVEFYTHLSQSYEQIIELGCGSGRIFDHLESNLKIGIDHAENALALVQSNRCCCADITKIPIASKSIECILIPYNTLCGLGGIEQSLSNLKECRRIIKDNGLLYFDIYAIDNDFEIEEDEGEDFLCSLSLNEDLTVDVFHYQEERRNYDSLIPAKTGIAPDCPELVMNYRYQLNDPRTTTWTESIPHSLITINQIYELLDQSDFSMNAIWGDFHYGPLKNNSSQIVISARPRL